MSVMRLHGIDREAWNRYTSRSPAWRYAVVEAGYKYNLTDLAAAIGREQLKKAAAFLARRAAIAGRFQAALAGRDWLRLPPDGPGNAWHLYIVRIVPERLSISRDDLIAKLAERGIGTSVHYIPLHIMPYYSKRYGLKPADFPRSLAAYEQAVSLPIYPGLSDEQVERIIAVVLETGDGNYLALRSTSGR